MPGGKFGFAWRGAEAGKFDVPWGITTDSQGNLFVSDTSNARVQRFLPDGVPVLTWGRDGGTMAPSFILVALPLILLAIPMSQTKGIIAFKNLIPVGIFY